MSWRRIWELPGFEQARVGILLKGEDQSSSAYVFVLAESRWGTTVSISS